MLISGRFLVISSLLCLGYSSTAKKASSSGSLLVIDPFIDFLHQPLLHLCKERNIKVHEAVSGYTDAILNAAGDTLPRNVVPNGLEWDDLKGWTDFLEDEEDDGGRISCVLSESDVGVSAAERIVQACDLKGNPFSPHLRSKYQVNEACKLAGLKTTPQILTGNWNEASEFINNLSFGSSEGSDIRTTRCVVKPFRGVASDGVYLCNTKEEARHHFEKLQGAHTYGGGINDKVLIQEYADGTEYALDTVSMDGELKVLAMWKYWKVPVNGAPFVYQCTELVPNEDEMTNRIIQYSIDAIKASGLRWGPTHTEVKMTKDGPRLIEINCRWHSANFYEICRRCCGYDAISATLDAYFDPSSFVKIPDKPPTTLIEKGKIVHLISSKEGNLVDVNFIEEIREMKTVIHAEVFNEIGEHVEKTVDIRTDSGYVLLCGSEQSVAEDYNRIVNELQGEILVVD